MINKDTTISFMTEQAIKSICTWNYPQPYNVYNFIAFEEALKNDAAILKQENKENYLCFWENGILAAYINFYFHNEKLMIGIGLSPEKCGKGLGKYYLEYGIKEANQRYPFKSLWVQVRSWNQRAVKCYKSCGFKEQYKEIYKDRNGIETEFIFMCMKDKIIIEPLSPDEYHKCSNIWDMKSQPLADKWLDEIKSGNRLVFIYKINGEFIGEGALVFDTGDPDYTVENRRVYVSRMIVKKEYRNRGIGSEILSYLIEKAKEMGYIEMTIGVDKDNVNALHMYRKYGFTEVLFDGSDENGEFFKLMKRI